MRSLLLIILSFQLGFLFGAVTPPLRTHQNLVLDANGAKVRFACVNWYGAHMERYVVNGLDRRGVDDIAAHIASMKFNCVRLVFSNDLFFKNPPLNASSVSANPFLAGRPAMEAFDAVVAALTSNGLMVVLNNHISEAGWCCSEDDGNGLWYTDQYDTKMWLSMWVKLTKRYAHNPLVVGADLRNELRAANGVEPTWGDGNTTTDWKIAAELCGNAILSENSDMLIFVEGLSFANILLKLQTGGEQSKEKLCDECLIQKHPVKLREPNRLVYSGHIYSWDGFPINKYISFEEAIQRAETYVETVSQTFTAPFWLGEFGTNSNDRFWQWTIRYLQQHPSIGWAYWALDGYQHSPGKGEDESFGIFKQDYKTIRDRFKLEDLQTVQSNTEHLHQGFPSEHGRQGFSSFAGDAHFNGVLV